MKTVGLALGGGGVRGLAHIPVLELLDELGLRPTVIAGTSMGAVIGALYASGLSGKDIRAMVRRNTISKEDGWRDVLGKKGDLLRWVSAFGPETGRGGMVRTDRFLGYLFGQIGKTTFQDLELPLLVVAADFWAAKEVVLSSGPLLPAVQASMAVPGVFAPVVMDGKVLVDGGVVNLVPFDHVVDRCDVTIAVDVTGTRTHGKSNVPNVLESLLGALDIMQLAAFDERMAQHGPDILVRPAIHDVGLLDFTKVDTVFRQAEPSMDGLRLEVEKQVGA